MSRSHYPPASILPDSVAVAKILITTARLYNHLQSPEPVMETIQDCIETIHFYLSLIASRHNIPGPPPCRHDEYNSHFPVIDVLRPSDLAALLLQKALRIHHLFHVANKIHEDSVSDAISYLGLLHSKLALK